VERLAQEIGKALRRARESRGLTLRDLVDVSGGRFKATSVAGYERGERNISVERFISLCEVYEVPAERLLHEIQRASTDRHLH
jgi:transcriptional regulator with XRE-family HTH domain